MKCPKCEKEINDRSKFCNNCGEKVEEKSMPDVDSLAKTCSQVWYILGYIRAKSTKEEREKFENALKNHQMDLWSWYHNVITYWEEWAKENNEKNKKTNGSKRTGVSKAERAKTK